MTANLLRAERRRSALRLRASAAIAAGTRQQLDPMSTVDTCLDVRAALATLSAADQEARLLVEWEGVDHAAGARITRCSPATFKTRVHRARRRLAAALQAGAQVNTLPETSRNPR